MYIGIKGVNKNLLELGKGIGMIGWEQIWFVEILLVILIIMVGICMLMIYLIGWVIFVLFIGGGGFGDYIFIGLNLYQFEYIIGGVVLVMILVIIIDYVLVVIE